MSIKVKLDIVIADLSVSKNAPTWDEFTQNTTFHGIRYVFDRTQYKFRRSVNSVIANG